jgi:site-specific DNA recombinase
MVSPHAHSSLQSPLWPRNGHILRVLIIARISTLHQDPRSLAEQEALCKAYVAHFFSGEVVWKIISSQGSGEVLDREELRQAEALVEAGQLDLVIVEDLARLCRRNRALDFCELCEDAGTRLIAINDHLDTAREDWRINGLIVSFQHEQHNTKASQRLKTRLRERFKTGGAFACPVYGYIKPADAKGDQDVTKDPAAAPIFDEWFRQLENGASYSEVADWLNSKGIPPGPYCDNRRWDCRMVRRVTFNPILKGERQHNVKMTRRVNKTGRRHSVDAPPEALLKRDCAHLRFIEPERYDRLIRLLEKKNEMYARGRLQHAADSRKGVSKKRTVWPGQHLVCGVCNRIYYWGGHGVAEHMMCSGSRDYRCWNAVSFDGFDAAHRLVQAILSEIDSLPDFDPIFREKVQARLEDRTAARATELARASDDLNGVLAQINRITDAIAQLGVSDVLGEKLKSLMTRRDDLQARRTELLRAPVDLPELPSMTHIRQQAREAISALAIKSPEFGRLMRDLVPSLKVYPYQLCDGGAVVLRAKLTLNLVPLTTIPEMDESGTSVLRRELTVDLFDPPQRAAYRQRVVELRKSGVTEREIAQRLSFTVTAVQRAAALHRLMQANNLTDPYVAVTDPAAQKCKLTRHLHARYRFEPLLNDGEDPS